MMGDICLAYGGLLIIMGVTFAIMYRKIESGSED